MNELITIDRPQMQLKNQSKSNNLLRCGSSSLVKRSQKQSSKPHSLFPSDFFSSADDEDINQSHKPHPLNQPILPNNTNITPLPRPIERNQPSAISSKVIIDFQKEFDEDKELLDMIQEGKGNHRPNSEDHSTKPFSSRLKRLNKTKVECEIIPEVDEEKMRTSTKIFYEDKAVAAFAIAKANKINLYNSNSNNNIFNSPQKKKAIKGIEKNNESLSTTNVTYESMKPKSKMKRRYHSGDNKTTAKMNIVAVNYKKADSISNNNSNSISNNNTNALKQLVLPSIKKKNPYIEYQKKFESLFDNLGDFSEEEHIEPKLIADMKGVLMKKANQRGKLGSAPHTEAVHLRKSPSTSSIPHINKSKMSLTNSTYNNQQHLQQHKKMSMKNASYLNGSHNNKTKSNHNSKSNLSPNKFDNRKELIHQIINYSQKHCPVKVINNETNQF